MKNKFQHARACQGGGVQLFMVLSQTLCIKGLQHIIRLSVAKVERHNKKTYQRGGYASIPQTGTRVNLPQKIYYLKNNFRIRLNSKSPKNATSKSAIFRRFLFRRFLASTTVEADKLPVLKSSLMFSSNSLTSP